MTSSRRTSLTAGLLYLLTFVSIPTIAIYGQVKETSYILSAGPDTSIIFGGILEIIVALAGIATAVTLFPILKKQREELALGLVAARILESATTFVGVAFILSIVTLRQDGVGSGALVISNTLVALYNRIFLLGQSFMPAICSSGISSLQIASCATCSFTYRYCGRADTSCRLFCGDVWFCRKTSSTCGIVRCSRCVV